MIPDVTRPCAFVFIREGDRMLVARMTDPSDGTIFHRPLGGGIGFGEVASDAARREIREELGAEIRRVRHLGVLENVFTYDGRSGHEIAFIFEAEPDGWSIDTFDGYAVPESAEAGGDETAVVVSLDVQGLVLYPEGVGDLLTGPGSTQAASAAVIRDGRILLARRRDDGTWELPGGGLEVQESPWDAAVRECREECGVEVRADHVVGIYHRPRRAFTITVIACAWEAGEPVASDEADRAGWYEVAAPLPEPIRPVVRERIDDALAGLRGATVTQID